VRTLFAVPQDILPVFKSPAVQVRTFYAGMPADAIAKNITVRMERWTGQAAGMRRQESRSVMGASIVRNLFQDNQDPNGALTQVKSLALATIPTLPHGTLPHVVLPYDPTSSTPIALVTVKTRGTGPPGESLLYDLAVLGFIFIVGIKATNTVLMTDYAQELRRHEGLAPLQAIRKAATLRVRPVTMTALAAFFAMIPTAMAEGEANAPLTRAILGGLLAGEPATLFVLPALYSLMVRGSLRPDSDDEHGQDHGHAAPAPAH
jgi:multidrug efflux pump subunit AcrB